jgi:hypothetical protein
MSESSTSKLLWIVVGAIVGGLISLSFDRVVKPMFAAKPKLQIVASKVQGKSRAAQFIVSNSGSAAAEGVSITVWATAAFSPSTDIVLGNHVGGVSDANCELGLYEAQLTGSASSSRPNAFNTPAKALLVRCSKINPNEEWRGYVEYSGQEAVMGLMANVKTKDTSENLYAMFSQEGKK